MNEPTDSFLEMHGVSAESAALVAGLDAIEQAMAPEPQGVPPEYYNRACDDWREMAAKYGQEKALNAQLLSALIGVMEYAHLGAQCCDIDPQEQPQFIAARAAIAAGGAQ